MDGRVNGGLNLSRLTYLFFRNSIVNSFLRNNIIFQKLLEAGITGRVPTAMSLASGVQCMVEKTWWISCVLHFLMAPFTSSRALGDHFYKKNAALPLKEQMISALPDVKQYKILQGDEFIVIACDGIWYDLFYYPSFRVTKILFLNHPMKR